MIQRLLYRGLVYLAAPVALGLELWRGSDAFPRSRRLTERLGGVSGAKTHGSGPLIWLHAASVGEVQALAPLVRRLRERRPEYSLLVTTMTVTGAERASSLFKDVAQHAFIPFDLPGAARRFVRSIEPRAAIFIETEIWPNLYLELAARRIPLLLASARLSEKSFARYRRLRSFMHTVLGANVTVAAQSKADVTRFAELGVPAAALEVSGNIKFDIQVPEKVRLAGPQVARTLFVGRSVWVAGSTHAIEEEQVLDAHAAARQRIPNLLLVLAPRHPPRFAEVKELLKKRGLRFASKSAQDPIDASTEVLLLDTLGDLTLFYAAADVAFVGGTLVPIGGHNLLEPAAVDVPVVCGPHVFNAPEIAQKLREADALVQIGNVPELANTLVELFSDEARRRELARNAAKVLAANRGAVDKVVELVEQTLAKEATGYRPQATGQK